MDLYNIRGSLSPSVVEITRKIQKTFTDDQITRLKEGKEKSKIYLIGTVGQNQADIDFFNEFGEAYRIPVQVTSGRIIIGDLS